MSEGIVIKIWNVKVSKNNQNSGSKQIQDSIAYIENPEKLGAANIVDGSMQVGNELTYVMNEVKTVKKLYVGSRHITDISNATEEMMQVKQYFGKLDGRLALHGVISLDETESDIKNAGKLMMLMADYLDSVFPGHQAVYAVHTNTENLHVHFIVNTVGLDGKKIHMDDKFMKNVCQKEVNRLALKYGFSPNAKWTKEKVEDPMTYPQRKELLRRMIDHAIEQTDSFDAFVAYLRADGFTVNVGRQISLQSDDMSKAIRTGSLGEIYKPEAIRKRILEKYEALPVAKAGDYYSAVLPEEMVQISPCRMKNYEDMSHKEKLETIRLLRLGRNPWRERNQQNWQIQRMADELNQIGYVYKLTHHYSKGTDAIEDALSEIIARKEDISAEKKEIRRLLKWYKPMASIYEEMKQYMMRAYLYDAYGRSEYQDDFEKYKELSERLYIAYGKTVEEVADFLVDTKGKLFYLKEQEKELSSHYLAIKKYSDQNALSHLADEYSFFHAVGHSEALYNAKTYGIYASDYKYISLDKNKDIQIRVVTTPDMDGEKATVNTTVTVFRSGVAEREISSKDISDKEFRHQLYELQSEYHIRKCHVEKYKSKENIKKI